MEVKTKWQRESRHKDVEEHFVRQTQSGGEGGRNKEAETAKCEMSYLTNELLLSGSAAE